MGKNIGNPDLVREISTKPKSHVLAQSKHNLVCEACRKHISPCSTEPFFWKHCCRVRVTSCDVVAPFPTMSHSLHNILSDLDWRKQKSRINI